MGSQEHPRFGGEGVVRACQALAAGHAYQLMVEAEVRGDRLFSWFRELRSVDRHVVNRSIQLRQVELLAALDELASRPGFDGFSCHVNVEPVGQLLAWHERPAVEAIFDQAFLHQLSKGLANGAPASAERIHEPALTQGGAGRDAAVDDRLANDAANGLSGRQALEPRQVPGLRGTVSVS